MPRIFYCGRVSGTKATKMSNLSWREGCEGGDIGTRAFQSGGQGRSGGERRNVEFIGCLRGIGHEDN